MNASRFGSLALAAALAGCASSTVEEAPGVPAADGRALRVVTWSPHSAQP